MKITKQSRPVKGRAQKRQKAPVVNQRRRILTKAVEEEFSRFKEYHPARRLAKNLRDLLMDFLMFDGAIESMYLDDLLYDLQGLFNLLDKIQLESEEVEKEKPQ